MQRTLGQPVIVPPGNSARSASTGERSARSRPRTFDTMWCTCAYDSVTMYSSTVTLPASHTRPRSLRSRSISMMCSARSLGCATSSAVSRTVLLGGSLARSRAGDRPRRDVAARDRAAAARAMTKTGSCPASCTLAANGAGFARRKRGVHLRRIARVAQGRAASAATGWPGRCRRRRCVPSPRARARGTVPRVLPRARRARAARTARRNGCRPACARSAIRR